MLQLQVAENLLLRELQETDAADLFALVEQNRAHLRTWLPWVDRNRTETDTLVYLKDLEDQKHQQRGLGMGIFLHGQLIGSIDMHNWQADLEKAEVGYWLAAAHQHKGIMYDCTVVFLAQLFQQLPLNKIEVQVVVGNERSLKLAARLGFQTEGIIRASYKMNGQLHDLVLTGLLRSEWRSAQL